MQVGGRRDAHEFGRFLLEKFAPVAVPARDAQLLRDGACLLLARAGEGDELETGVLQIRGRLHETTERRAEDGDTDAGHENTSEGRQGNDHGRRAAYERQPAPARPTTAARIATNAASPPPSSHTVC
jgi:hypothetical protein